MNRNAAIGIAFAVLCTAMIVLFLRIAAARNESAAVRATMEQLRDSLGSARRSLDSLRAQTPGLGEYMSAIQLHTAKLWFAAQSSNWPLASYEINELGEAMDGAEGLHARRDSVDVSAVLQSVRQTQIALLDTAIATKNHRAFTAAYGQTLAACNGCHRPAGYGFIHIITPTREPVTNQRWNPGL
jgi:hypothetical protein